MEIDIVGDYRLLPIEFTKYEGDKYDLLKAYTKKVDIFAGGCFSELLEKNEELSPSEIFEKFFKNRIVEIDDMHPYCLIANGCKLTEE